MTNECKNCKQLSEKVKSLENVIGIRQQQDLDERYREQVAINLDEQYKHLCESNQRQAGFFEQLAEAIFEL